VKPNHLQWLGGKRHAAPFDCLKNLNYICSMKLTLKIKLLPAEEQADLLLKTIREANRVCDISI